MTVSRFRWLVLDQPGFSWSGQQPVPAAIAVVFGPQGPQGERGVGIASIERTSGDGSPGTTDTYTITYDDDSTSTFEVYNGADGNAAQGISTTGAEAGDILQYNSTTQRFEPAPIGDIGGGGGDPAGTAAATMAAHVAATDPHPQYLTPSEGNAAYEAKNANIQAHVSSTSNPHGTTAAQVGADPAGTAASAISSHTAAADPHPQYLTSVEADAAYEAKNAAANAITAHTAATDPHPQYLTPSEGNAAYEAKNANIQAHIASTSNPHGTTAAQVGADPAGTAASALTAHTAALDPHPQYLTSADGDGAYEAKNANIQAHIASTSNPHGTTAAQVGADPAGTAASAVSAHTAAADPHPQYLTSADGDAAYEAKNANIQAHITSTSNPHGTTAAQVGADPAGTAASSMTAHTAAADPHPQYTTTAEAAAAAPVQSVAGKTGAVTLAKADVGLGNVDNTSDANKPVSTATQTALNSKANLNNPSFTGQMTLNGAGTFGQFNVRAATGTAGIVLDNPDGTERINMWARASAGNAQISTTDANLFFGTATTFDLNLITNSLIRIKIQGSDGKVLVNGSGSFGHFNVRAASGTANISLDNPTGSELLNFWSRAAAGISQIAAANARLDIGTAGSYDLNFLTNSLYRGGISADGLSVIFTGVANSTTGSAANVYVDAATGRLYRSTSGRQYKCFIDDYQPAATVEALKPRFYRASNDPYGPRFAGFISDEVEAAGFPEFVVYGRDGKPDALHYGNMVALLVHDLSATMKSLREAKEELAQLVKAAKDLGERVSALENV